MLGPEKEGWITIFSWDKLVSHPSSTLPRRSPPALWLQIQFKPACSEPAGRAAYSIQALEGNPNDSRGQRSPGEGSWMKGSLAQ